MAEGEKGSDVSFLIQESSNKKCVINVKTKVFCGVLLLLAVLTVAVVTVAVVMTKEPLKNDNKNGNSETPSADLYVLSEEDANKTDAFCLDGSPPAYYFRKGSGAGNSSWIVWLQGGGACSSLVSCYQRSFTTGGSTQALHQNRTLHGIFSADKDVNPDFYTWNAVNLMYCDGLFFGGNRQDVVKYSGRSLYFRGRRNLNALIGHLLPIGLGKADRVILGGSSAGAMAAYWGGADVIALLPSSADVKIVADSGMFMNLPDKDGVYSLNNTYASAVELHNATESINKVCLVAQAPSERWKCYYPENAVLFEPVPTFILNCLYDNAALYSVLKTTCRPDQCQGKELAAVQNYRTTLLKVATSDPREKDGAFLIACFKHVINRDQRWAGYTVNGTSMRQAVGDWYFDRTSHNVHVDMGADFNPTCNQYTSLGSGFTNSMEQLAAAEGRVLQYVISRLKGFYVPISNNKRMWTIKTDTHKPDTLPIVMVHGFAAAVGFWLLNIDAIAEHRAVYAFDLLGFGRSSPPKFSEDASIAEEEFVNSIEEWRERVGLEKFILLGHSFGGFLSASYAIKHPDRVQHLILADPWGIDRVQPPWLNAIITGVLMLFPLPAVRAAGSWGPWILQLLGTFRPDLQKCYGRVFPDDRFMDYAYHCIAQESSGEAAFFAMQSSLQALNPILPRVTHLRQDVPITFIYGAWSWVNLLEKEPWRRVQVLRRSSVDVHIIPRAGHQVFANKPAKFNRLVVQVCEETDRTQQSETVNTETN